MKILKAKYENGQVKLTEPAPEPGPVDVEVVFLDEMIGAGTKLFEILGPGRLFALRPIRFLRTIGQVKRRLWTLKNSEQPNPSSLLGPLP
jgi:hypothetical protein